MTLLFLDDPNHFLSCVIFIPYLIFSGIPSNMHIYRKMIAMVLSFQSGSRIPSGAFYRIQHVMSNAWLTIGGKENKIIFKELIL